MSAKNIKILMQIMVVKKPKMTVGEFGKLINKVQGA